MAVGDPARTLGAAGQTLGAARRIVVLTGAGVSAESGIATFRDALSGLWANFSPQQLATEEGFRSDPALVWNWYKERRIRIAAARPNAAHEALARLAHGPRAQLVTQNVDGLHQRAGASRVIELHGNIGRAKCLALCGWMGPAETLEAQDARVPPRCPACSALARPDVVWFGEMLPQAAWDAAEAACQVAQVCLVIGTSAQVYPAAGLAELARRHGAQVIVVNPEATPLDDDAAYVLRGTAAHLVPALLGAAGR